VEISAFRAKYKYDVATPMMQQYLDIKFQNQDSLLLFRMGDFYELFFDDAITTSKILGLALAKRGKHGDEDLAMCGVPHHAIETYLRKLIEEGYKVAIVEQLETPEEAKQRGYKAVVKREVVRIITPGTVTEDSIIVGSNPNYLISVRVAQDIAAIAYLDINTAEFKVASVAIENLYGEITKLSPKEIIISEKDVAQPCLQNWRNKMVVQVESYFSTVKCQKIIEIFYGIKSYSAIGALSDSQIAVIGAILEYLNITQKKNLPLLALPHIVDISNFMIIDASTRQNLEIVNTVSGSYKGSLLSVINHTMTHNGSRLLYQFLSAPLNNIDEIALRHQRVEFFVRNMNLTRKLRHILKETSDLERMISKISCLLYTSDAADDM
jgi:DNA mismatch repair protein MutS